MPCDASYMDPTEKEKNLLEVNRINYELMFGKRPSAQKAIAQFSSYGKGILDEEVRKACEGFKKLNKCSIENLSLEAQIWWRDHQIADKKRKKAEAQEKKEKQEIEKILKKLTLKERKMLKL